MDTLNELGQFLEADIYKTNFRPQDIKEYVKCGPNIFSVQKSTEDVITAERTVGYAVSLVSAFLPSVTLFKLANISIRSRKVISKNNA